MAFWVQLEKMDQGTEPLLFLTPGHACLSFAAALIHNPLVRFTIKPHINMPLTLFSVELQNRTDTKLQWQQTNKALKQATKLV